MTNDREAQLTRMADRHRQGHVAEAEAFYRAFLRDAPTHAEARHLLGVARLQSGAPREAEAEVRAAITNDPSCAKYYNTLANVLSAADDFEGALEATAEALRRDPDFPSALYNRATTLLLLERPDEAEPLFRDLLTRGMRTAQTYNNLGTSLLKLKRYRDAEAVCREGLAAAPDDPALLTTLAYALDLGNALDDAPAVADRLAAVATGFPMAGVLRACLLRRLKRYDEALAAADAVDETRLSPTDRMIAAYEKAVLLDAMDDAHAPRALAEFRRFNALLAASPEGRTYDPDIFLAEVRSWRRWADARRSDPPAPDESASAGPVFFVGFPRSGTTLMEQALKSHPSLITTEEVSPLLDVETAARRLGRERGMGFPAVLDHLSDDDIAMLRETFAARTTAIVGPTDGKILVDKLPLNIIRLDLARRVLPGAKAIVALRDPRDAVLSCYMQRFSLNEAMANFLDLERAAKTYAEVMGLWLAGRDSMALPQLVYRYEDLVADFEGTVRDVLDFIGVGWHDDISRYREAALKRDIRTPSYRQVTEKLYTKAIGRWRKYADDLAAPFAPLAPFVKAFGYDAD